MSFKVLIQKILRFVLYVSLSPVYWISCVVPKDRNLWIFGAWFGQKFADNSKYLFLYVQQEHPEIRPVWLAHNPRVVSDLRSMGYEAYMAYSIKGFLLSMRARAVVVSTGLGDVNRYAIGRARKVQLWHGTPLKKIGFDDRITMRWQEQETAKIERISRSMLPFLRAQYDLIISPSEEVSKKLASAFRISKGKIGLTGYPRNDALFNVPWLPNDIHPYLKDIRKETQYEYLIAYLPTHREEGRRETDFLFNNYGFNINNVEVFLEEHNSILVVKTHYYNRLSLPCGVSKRRIYTPSDDELPDIYPLLKATDILITDYSSVYFDYLLLNRPIIFAPFDLEEYVQRDRELYYDYDEVTPGPKAKDWPEVLELIEQVMEKDQWKERREQICRRFNEFTDGESSRRVFEEIQKLLAGSTR